MSQRDSVVFLTRTFEFCQKARENKKKQLEIQYRTAIEEEKKLPLNKGDIIFDRD